MTIRYFGLMTENMPASDRVFWLVDNYGFDFDKAERWVIKAEEMGYPSKP